MPLVLKDRVKETSTTTGTGTFTLAGASTGFQSFSVIGNGNTTFYTIALQGGNEWEVGVGTYTSSGTTLARNTVIESSNGGTLVNFSAGTKDVFVTQPAERTVYDSTGSTGGTDSINTNTANTVVRRDASGNFSAGTITAALSGNATNVTGTVAVANGGTGATTASITSFNNITGLSAAGTTGTTTTNLVFSTAPSITTLTAAGAFTASATTQTINIGASQTTGATNIATGNTSGVLTVGGAAGTGTMTIGRSTGNQTTSIQGGATASGSTKAVNLGTGGLAGSTTNIAIGSTTGTSTTTVNGVFTTPVPQASNGLVVNSNTVSTSYSIPSGSSASSVGPITVASGQTVTVPSGSRWVVL